MDGLSSIEALSRFNLWLMGVTALLVFVAFVLEALPPDRPAWLSTNARNRGKLWMTGAAAIFGVLAFIGAVRLSDAESAAAAPRVITADAGRRFLELVGRTRKGRIDVGIRGQDQEAAVFGEQVIQLLAAGGWEVKGSYLMLTGPMEPGIVVTVRTNSPAPPEALLLLNALNSIGIEATGRVLAELPADESLRLTIGPKP